MGFWQIVTEQTTVKKRRGITTTRGKISPFAQTILGDHISKGEKLRNVKVAVSVRPGSGSEVGKRLEALGMKIDSQVGTTYFGSIKAESVSQISKLANVSGVELSRKFTPL